MHNFTHRIQTKDGNLLFYFNLIYTIHGSRYFISAVDTKSQGPHFYMQFENGSWRLADDSDVTHWIKAIEDDLALAIENR